MDDTTRAISEYISESSYDSIPLEVVERAKFHILDTLAAIVSGMQLPAGERAAQWASANLVGERGPCTVVDFGRFGSPHAAALCNGIAAHADETDDTHAASTSHPGCSVIPTAIACGELLSLSGKELIRSVVVGYDVGCRVGRAISRFGRDEREGKPSSHAAVGAFCSAATAAAAFGFDSLQVRYLLSYVAQQVSGVMSYLHSPDHTEKAFVYGGMPASQALLAASLVLAGCEASEDVFGGALSWIETTNPHFDRTVLLAGLGHDYELMHTTLKKYAVGSPAASAIEATLVLLAKNFVDYDNILKIYVRLFRRGAFIVSDRSMPNINIRYLIAAVVLDGRYSFHMAHDRARLSDTRTNEMMDRIEVIGDPELTRASGSKVSFIVAQSDQSVLLEEQVQNVRGSPADPMSWSEVSSKADDLMAPIVGPSRSRLLCRMVRHLDQLQDINVLTRFLSP